jgi:hypothetical protein
MRSKEVKFFLVHAIGHIRERVVQLHSFFASTPNGGVCPAALPPQNFPSTQTQAGRFGEDKFLPKPGFEIRNIVP